MKIPFTKAHGAKNDFLLTWADRRAVIRTGRNRARHLRSPYWHWRRWLDADASGPPADEAHAAIQLYNSDGSMSEISGNGTRCVAAFLVHSGLAQGERSIRTGAGIKASAPDRAARVDLFDSR